MTSDLQGEVSLTFESLIMLLVERDISERGRTV